MSLLKWREARVKEKKKHAEKRMRIEESSGLPYVPELTKPTHKDVERFVRRRRRRVEEERVRADVSRGSGTGEKSYGEAKW